MLWLTIIVACKVSVHIASKYVIPYHHRHLSSATVTKCWSSKGLRDEIFIQLCKQTTGNSNTFAGGALV
jgi:hypothetical protein